MKSEKVVPKTPEKAAKMRYSVPISLWLVEKNHRFVSIMLLVPLLIAASYFLVFVGVLPMALFLAIAMLLLIGGVGLFAAKFFGYFPEPESSAV